MTNIITPRGDRITVVADDTYHIKGSTYFRIGRTAVTLYPRNYYNGGPQLETLIKPLDLPRSVAINRYGECTLERLYPCRLYISEDNLPQDMVLGEFPREYVMALLFRLELAERAIWRHPDRERVAPFIDVLEKLLDHISHLP